MSCITFAFYEMKVVSNAKSLVHPVFCVFSTTFTMPSRNPPTSMRCGKGFMKAETTTLLKTIEQILPIDAEAWNEMHDVLLHEMKVVRMQNPLFTQFFAFFQQLLPCQVAILQHL